MQLARIWLNPDVRDIVFLARRAWLISAMAGFRPYMWPSILRAAVASARRD